LHFATPLIDISRNPSGMGRGDPILMESYLTSNTVQVH